MKYLSTFFLYSSNFSHDFLYEIDTIQMTAYRLLVPTTLLIGHNTTFAAQDFLIYDPVIEKAIQFLKKQ